MGQEPMRAAGPADPDAGPVQQEPAPPGPARTDQVRTGMNPRLKSHLGSIAKAISWRITAGIDTFLISWLVTGSVKGAGAIALMELFTKIGLFWAHERAWLRIGKVDLARWLPRRYRPGTRGVE